MTARSAFWLLCIMNVVWGAAYSIGKWTLLFVPPATLAAIRFFVSGLLLWGALGKNRKPFQSSDWWKLFWVGFLGITIGFLAHYKGISLTTATKTSLEIALEPIFVFLISIVFLKEPWQPRIGLAILLSFPGAILLLAGDKSMEDFLKELSEGGEIFGDLLVIVSVILGALYTTMMKPVATRIGPMEATAASCLIGGGCLIPFAALEFFQGSVIVWSFSVVCSLIFTTFICTAFGYTLWNRCLTELLASEIAITLYIQPLAGVIVGMLFMKETLSLKGFFGAGLIIGGVFLTQNKH